MGDNIKKMNAAEQRSPTHSTADQSIVVND
jgi:hypothetical protein